MKPMVKHLLTKTTFLAFLVAILWMGMSHTAFGQSKKRVIQLSGVVLGQDSVSGLPGVHVYVPKAGRGTTTNSVGFFSMPVLVGDSIIISSVGFTKQYYIVPNHPSEFLTVIFEMNEDITYLEAVTATAFPTEEVFKEAVLALNLPPDQEIDQKNLNAELLALILKTTPMDGPQNQRYYLNQWASHQSDKFMPVTNPFLNPFNWVKFFNSLKTDKKKKPKK
jgi:hypothetical protein